MWLALAVNFGWHLVVVLAVISHASYDDSGSCGMPPLPAKKVDVPPLSLVYRTIRSAPILNLININNLDVFVDSSISTAQNSVALE